MGAPSTSLFYMDYTYKSNNHYRIRYLNNSGEMVWAEVESFDLEVALSKIKDLKEYKYHFID